VTKEGSMTSMWVMRWVIVALSAALAVVLIARGNVLIGVLVGALAVTRMVFFVRLQRRRDQFRRRMAGRRNRPSRPQ
jgi:energy-converting hydrogenase Eha subunit G